MVEVNNVPLMAGLITVFVAFAFFRMKQSHKKTFESYKLTLYNNMLSREQLHQPYVAIYFYEISSIVKAPNGAIVIRGKDPAEVIGIPPQLDRFEELEAALQLIKLFTAPPKKGFFEKTAVVWIALALLAIIGVYTMTNKIILLISAIISGGIMGIFFVKVQLSKAVDINTKRRSLFILIFMFSIIGTAVIKLKR